VNSVDRFPHVTLVVLERTAGATLSTELAHYAPREFSNVLQEKVLDEQGNYYSMPRQFSGQSRHGAVIM